MNRNNIRFNIKLPQLLKLKRAVLIWQRVHCKKTNFLLSADWLEKFRVKLHTESVLRVNNVKNDG